MQWAYYYHLFAELARQYHFIIWFELKKPDDLNSDQLSVISRVTQSKPQVFFRNAESKIVNVRFLSW